jgi:integrase
LGRGDAVVRRALATFQKLLRGPVSRRPAEQRRESLGDVRKLTLKDARKAAAQRFAKVELGVDPAVEKAAAQNLDRTKFGVVADRYQAAKKPDLRPNSWNASKRYLEVYWQPLRARAIADITPKIVAPLLTTLIEKHGRTAAARARGVLSAVFAWAIKEQLAERNPTIGTNNPAEGIPERDRVLDDREIRVIWNACLDDDFGRIVKLLLITACRRDEIGGLSWPEIDFEVERIVLPGTRTKSKRAHILPLPRLAIGLLREVLRKEDREFLFGLRGGAFSRWSYEKLALDKRIVEAGGKQAPWRLHDLRRTAATRMAELGVQPHVIEAVLNHSYGSQVARTYNRHSYEAEKREALSRWAERLQTIVAGAQVIEFARLA